MSNYLSSKTFASLSIGGEGSTILGVKHLHEVDSTLYCGKYAGHIVTVGGDHVQTATVRLVHLVPGAIIHLVILSDNAVILAPIAAQIIDSRGTQLGTTFDTNKGTVGNFLVIMVLSEQLVAIGKLVY